MKLRNLLPFMDNEDLKELVQKIKSNEVKGVKLVHLYPFLDREDIDDLVDVVLKEGKSRDLYSALPFISKKKLNEIYERIQAGELEGFKEEALLPFLGKDKIKELVDRVIKQNVDENLDDEITEKVEKAIEKAFEE